MTENYWDAVEAKATVCRALPKPQRAERARELCGSDADLLDGVLGALNDPPPTDFIEPPAPSMPEPGSAGDRLGSFEIVSEISRGAMGVVYRARQEGLDRDVALKVLPISRSGDDDSVDRFHREVRSASRLQHPNIVPVLTFGETEECVWYAMPVIEGHDLAQELRIHRKPEHEGALLPEFSDAAYITAIVELVVDVARALQHAHDRGVVHRDIKPQNLLLDEEGRVHVADFGLASDAFSASLTKAPMVHGTPQYMSPEQALVIPDSVDRPTDVYSLAVVLYELLAQVRPVRGDSIADLAQQLQRGANTDLRRENPRVSADLAVVCETAMQQYPKDRYASIGAFADDLERVLRHEAILARPISWARKLARKARKHRALLASVATIALLAAGTLVLERRRESLRERDEFVDVLRQAVDAGHFDGDIEVLKIGEGARERLRSYRLTGESKRAVELYDESIGRFLDAEATELRAQWTAGRDGLEVETLVGPLRLTGQTNLLFDAIGRASVLSAIFDDHVELKRLATINSLFSSVSVAFHPFQVEITGAFPPASAFAVPFDVVSESFGEPKELGPLPVESARMPPGEWRIVVVADGVGIGEFDRQIKRSESSKRLEVLVRPAPLVSLRNIPEGTLRFTKDAVGSSLVHEEVSVPAFSIGEAEISNAQFMRYLEESGGPRPKTWERIGFDGTPESLPGVGGDVERWSALPVTSLAFDDAQRCAEWLGGRVPSRLECGRAGRGDVHLVHIAAVPDNAPNGHVNAIRGRLLLQEPAPEYRQLCEHLQPVASERFRQQPWGLFHMHGNVREWTGQRVVLGSLGVIRALPTTRYTYGAGYNYGLLENMASYGSQTDDHSVSQLGVGVRLARSIDIDALIGAVD